VAFALIIPPTLGMSKTSRVKVMPLKFGCLDALTGGIFFANATVIGS